MKCGHLIIVLMVVIDFQESSFISEYLIKPRLLINVIYKELHEHTTLTFKNDSIDQF